MFSRAAVYRIFRRAHEDAASVKAMVIAMVVAAVLVVGFGVLRVTRQHEVLVLGYKLARESDHVRELRETRRRLELQRAVLSSPDRIRRLATELGMTPVAPDRIRVVHPHRQVALQP
jgi:cell division protein FtsL